MGTNTARQDAIRGAYRMTGSSSFYDGMITCTTLAGKAVCRLVWAMNKAECDEYLTKARESSDPAVRKEYYDLFQIELANDPAYAFICYIDANYVASARLHGISADTVMGHHGVGIFWNVCEWTLD